MNLAYNKKISKLRKKIFIEKYLKENEISKSTILYYSGIVSLLEDIYEKEIKKEF